MAHILAPLAAAPIKLDSLQPPDSVGVSSGEPSLSNGQRSADGSVIVDFRLPFPKMRVGSSKRQEGLLISFEGLTYSVTHTQTKKPKVILDNVHGFFEPGKMSALMGPSGSGKTTLLDILAGRKTIGTMKGEVLFGDQKPTQSFLRRWTGYVEQFDTLLGSLTVYQMLLYTAELKLPESMSRGEKRERVEAMIQQLQLEKCRDTRIGDASARGISGGQAKRVNIGISLITDPKVMFLDEPTSGLDSHTASEVMSVVKGLVANGRTICATIHSPSAYTFRQFDNLLLLLDGRMAYFGANGQPMLDHFSSEKLGVSTFEKGDNEAEWMVEVTTTAAQAGEASRFVDHYNAELAAGNMKALAEQKVADTLMVARGDRNSAGQLAKQVARSSGTTVSMPSALSTLFRYRTLTNYRNGQYMGSRLADKILVVFILMTLYQGRGDEGGLRGIQNMIGMLFLWVTLASFGAGSYVPSLVTERSLFTRERNDGLYSVLTYLFHKMSEELLLAAGITLALSAVVYPVVGLRGSFVVVWLAYLITLSVGIAAAYFIAALSPNMDVANAALPAYMVSLLYFSGLVMNFQDIPAYWNWYSRIDFVRYGFTALLVNHFGGHNDEVLPGRPVLDFYGVDGESAWANLGYELAFFAFFFMLAFLTLKYVRHERR